MHARGAPHLADPSRLLASAERIYGDEMADALGSRAAGARAQPARGGGRGDASRSPDRELDVEYTPGHASHHVVYFDRSRRHGVRGRRGRRADPAVRLRPPADPAAGHRRRCSGTASIDLVAGAAAGAARADALRHGGRSTAAPRADDEAACDEQAGLVARAARATMATRRRGAWPRSSRRSTAGRARRPARDRGRVRGGSAGRAAVAGPAPLLAASAPESGGGVMATETVEIPRVGGPGTGGGAWHGDRPERQPQHLRPRRATRSRG